MAKVILKKVQKIYDNEFKAVNDINLEINDGEFMVFVGPSGCGKSTTLRMIAGLEEISDGQIYIGDKLVNNIHPKDRGIAMVFQNYALYPHMTVYENMAFSLKIKKTPKNVITEKVHEAAKILGLEGELNRKPKELSGGQRQRVAVGRAIVRNPEVFLFDEPLSNLDAKLRVHMRVEISKLHKKLKATMIYVTHDQVEAMTMGDRICVMNFGRIMQVDNPSNLYSYPANKFVASFIGSPSMNFIQGKLINNNGCVVIKIEETELVISKNKACKVKDHLDEKVWLGIRPEHINLTEEDNTDSIEGIIDVIEYMGSESYVYFSFAGGIFTAKIHMKNSKILKVGSKEKFMLNMDQCHIFDLEKEQNISL
ncbi:sn-glycerol-3-phosphate ABC transporter ATP-binding protein UgpC [Clostridium sp. JS66]|uniref:ABC transporter ATP-binding protein n=1 Tax=Clostridium sp. JS66 TaxID=3064705 RepID=UPI00298E2C85|nr:sn-glycerol-3-phosphate ABC transporter ATP-binding protein UgpC [Clostridium sp. JS66]WPC41567.1 sn-glycerol-3-phosphate ABC transporter ATP-binding protein UgpC [Clostridium sp. JS66]